jgi:hypothetical protein
MVHSVKSGCNFVVSRCDSLLANARHSKLMYRPGQVLLPVDIADAAPAATEVNDIFLPASVQLVNNCWGSQIALTGIMRRPESSSGVNYQKHLHERGASFMTLIVVLLASSIVDTVELSSIIPNTNFNSSATVTSFLSLHLVTEPVVVLWDDGRGWDSVGMFSSTMSGKPNPCDCQYTWSSCLFLIWLGRRCLVLLIIVSSRPRHP